MDILLLLKAIVMGLVEGATEFLPISSTGHLIITGDLLQFLTKDKRDVFEIVIQLGAILAVVWLYRSRFLAIARHINEKQSQQLITNLFIAFLPLAMLGLAFQHQIKSLLFNPKSVAITLIIGGFLILLIEKKLPKVRIFSMDEMDWKLALKVGIAQAVALIPGASRAGSTIIGGMIFGLSRTTATEFSFFLAVPVMFAATCYDLIKHRQLFSADDLLILALGFVTAFLAALVVIKGLLRYVANHDFTLFAWYRIIFGALVLWYYW